MTYIYVGCTLIRMSTRITLYIWKENQEQFDSIEHKGQLINKLLKVYFQKHSKEAIYTEPEPTA